MNKRVTLSTALTFLVFLTSCTLHKEWSYVERLGLTPNQKLIFVPYDPDAASAAEDQQFLLYYFTTQPFDASKPTVLFIAGGPGIVTTDDDPLVQSLTGEYNVVYFHPRGSGFSQFPESNWYDRYLRIKFAVKDIERIRNQLGIEYWDAIVAHSAGTVLAQQYAGTFGGMNRLRKLVLMAPLSRHSIAVPKERSECRHDPYVCAADKVATAIRDKQIDTLSEIYSYSFSKLNGYQAMVLDAVEKILDRVDEKFGNLPFLIDDYERLKNLGGRDLLKEHALDYSKAFFRALQQLRFAGWLPISDDAKANMLAMQRDIGVIVARELACKTPKFSMWVTPLKTKEIVNQVIQSTEEKYSYCATKDAIDKLMLQAPSVARGANFETDTDRWTKDMKATQIEVLKEIFDKEIKEPSDYQEIILKEVSNILDRVEREFGGLEFVIQNYKELSVASKQKPEKPVPGKLLLGASSPGGLSKLSGNSLDYGLPFFKALQSLLFIGRPSPQDDPETKRRQRAIGVIIVRELADTKEPQSKSAKEALGKFKNWEPVIEHERISLTDAIDAVDRIDLTRPTQWAKDMKEKQLTTLKNLYDKSFSDLDGYQETILNEAKRILDLVENQFGGCLQCVIKNYEELKKFRELQNLNLDYDDAAIYTALKSLLAFNTTFLESGPEASRGQYVGAIIGNEIACRIAKRIEGEDEFSSRMLGTGENINSYCDAAKNIFQARDKQSERVYYVVSTYDGLNIGFLKEWRSGHPNDIRDALRKSAGEVHYNRCRKLHAWKPCLNAVNQYVEKVGIVGDEIRPWDPAGFVHKVPTLILEGGADPVVAGGQPEDIYNQGLSGDRILIRFPGIGHSMNLPKPLTDTPIASKGPCLGERAAGGLFLHSSPLGCLIASFLKMDLEAFKDATILKEIKTTFHDMLGKIVHDQNQGVQIFSCSPESTNDVISRDSKPRPVVSFGRASSVPEKAPCEEIPAEP
jgi:pimeloyl-ACP methyl ester carboxylesterase